MPEKKELEALIVAGFKEQWEKEDSAKNKLEMKLIRNFVIWELTVAVLFVLGMENLAAIAVAGPILWISIRTPSPRIREMNERYRLLDEALSHLKEKNDDQSSEPLRLVADEELDQNIENNDASESSSESH